MELDTLRCKGTVMPIWAGFEEDTKSTSGMIMMINGTASIWNSRKQSCVALS